MKKTIYFLLLLQSAGSFLFAQQGNQTFTLKGRVTGKAQDSVVVSYRNGEAFVTESKPILNQQFSISGGIRNPVSARILFKNKGEEMSSQQYWERAREIYIEPGITQISGDPAQLNKMKITGSKTQLELEELNAKVEPVRLEMKPIIDALSKEKDHEKASEIRDQLEPYNNRIKKITYDFFVAHPNSFVTLDLMRLYASRMGIDSVKQVYGHFNEKSKETEQAKLLDQNIKKIESGMPGKQAANFTADDINGKSLSLSDFKGKYVIVDFWASWCVPCRKGNPHLIQLYNTYHAKGLEIIGISDDDRNHEAWKKAVAQDQIGIWHHVLRGLNMELRRKNLPNPQDISEKYGISSLPTKILIDPEGKIVGRYGDQNGGSEEQLNKKLASVFNP